MPRVLKAQKCLYFAPFHAQRDEMNRFAGHFIDLTGCYWLQTMDQTDPIKAALYCTPHTHQHTLTHTPRSGLQHLTQSQETERVVFFPVSTTHDCTSHLTVSGHGLHCLAICWLMMHRVISHLVRTAERSSLSRDLRLWIQTLLSFISFFFEWMCRCPRKYSPACSETHARCHKVTNLVTK